MVEVRYTKAAIRSLARLPANTRNRIERKIDQLAREPERLANNITKLQGREAYRLRVGDWRIIYEWIDGVPRILLIIAVGTRGGIYE